MAMLRTENDLAVLRIRLDRRGLTDLDGRRSAAVVFELQVGPAETVELARVAPSAIGSGEGGPVFLPPGVLGSPAVLDALAGRSGLWLELPAPSGSLRPLPWEQALRPLGVPVLRLPYFALRPRVTDGPLTVVLCASSPAAKEFVPVADFVLRFVALAARLGGIGRVHVFTDDQWGLPSGIIGTDPEVVVHDPRAAADYELPRRTTEIGADQVVANPWLRWIRTELAGSAVDHVHFACHGYLNGGDGALALASSPLVNTDRAMSRFVGAPELLGLLSSVGAWSAGFTGPLLNYSPLGLRALADAVAEGRPGPVVAHESTADPELLGLGDALSVTVGDLHGRSPQLGDTAVWVHPQRVDQIGYPTEGEAARGDRMLDEFSRSALLGTATAQALEAPATATWVASSARVLEQAQARWLSATQTGVGEVAAGASWPSEAADALAYVSGILEKHVRSDGGTL